MTVENTEVVTDSIKNEHQVMLEEDLNTFLDTHKVKQLYIKSETEIDARRTYSQIKDYGKVKIANESRYFYDGVLEEKGIWFTITNIQVNKGNAIKKLAKHLHVDLKNTYGFGNDYNDIKMFKTVNHSIVMENANDNLKKHAKIIAKSNDKDGVANFLEETFLK